MPRITHLLALISALTTDRTRLALENIALRQQIVVLKRSVKRAKIEDSDRIFWILMRRLLDTWRDTLMIVDPEIIELIRHMSREDATWGAPRVRSELALLGNGIAESTVAKYMVRHPKPPSQT